MKKIYNIIFPVYMLWAVPPVIFISMIFNFIIDSAVLLICDKILKIKDIFSKYKKVIFKVWGFGFLSDLIGAIFLFVISSIFSFLEIPIRYNIDYNPFGNIYALIITIIGILISSILIYVFNRYISFKKLDISSREKCIMALTLAIVTAPYLFLLPSGY